MGKIVLIAELAISIMLGTCSAASAYAAVDNDVAICVVDDGNNPDLFLDCFESAVKSGDVELAARIASELYRMNLNEAQRSRFVSIEDRISRKDYQAYREYLRNAEVKSSTFYDDEIVTYDGESDFGGESFVGDFFDVLSGMYGMIDSLGNDGWYRYEQHDTLDGGFFDMFFDVFAGGSEEELENKNVPSDSDLDAALDEYEKYVNMAVESLRRMFEGGDGSWEDFEKYSDKASEIANDLENSSSEMTKAQFKRYMRIIERMITGLF